MQCDAGWTSIESRGAPGLALRCATRAAARTTAALAAASTLAISSARLVAASASPPAALPSFTATGAEADGLSIIAYSKSALLSLSVNSAAFCWICHEAAAAASASALAAARAFSRSFALCCNARPALSERRTM
eukprot:scaffold146333_cov27-Tisochrysis_lutea.AAC.3